MFFCLKSGGYIKVKRRPVVVALVVAGDFGFPEDDEEIFDL